MAVVGLLLVSAENWRKFGNRCMNEFVLFDTVCVCVFDGICSTGVAEPFRSGAEGILKVKYR